MLFITNSDSIRLFLIRGVGIMDELDYDLGRLQIQVARIRSGPRARRLPEMAYEYPELSYFERDMTCQLELRTNRNRRLPSPDNHPSTSVEPIPDGATM